MVNEILKISIIFTYSLIYSLSGNRNNICCENRYNGVEDHEYNFTTILKKYNCSFSEKVASRYSKIEISNRIHYLTNYKYSNGSFRYALFSLAYNYTKENYYVFINSLKRTGYKGDIFFFVSNQIDADTKFYLESKNSFYLKLYDYWPYYSNNNYLYPIETSILDKYVPKLKLEGKLKFIIMRYIMIYVFLIKYGNRYDYILSLDLRDVIFQENPFGWSIPKGIVLFEESRTQIHKENKKLMSWIRNVDKKYSKIISPYYVINGGSIYCTISDCLEFFNEYSVIANKSNSLNPNDQSIFNIIAYHEYKGSNLFVFPNYFGPVKTMAIEDRQPICTKNNYNKLNGSYILTNKENKVVNIDGSIPFILHANYLSLNDPFIIKLRESFNYKSIIEEK